MRSGVFVNLNEGFVDKDMGGLKATQMKRCYSEFSIVGDFVVGFRGRYIVSRRVVNSVSISSA